MEAPSDDTNANLPSLFDLIEWVVPKPFLNLNAWERIASIPPRWQYEILGSHVRRHATIYQFSYGWQHQRVDEARPTRGKVQTVAQQRLPVLLRPEGRVQIDARQLQGSRHLPTCSGILGRQGA